MKSVVLTFIIEFLQIVICDLNKIDQIDKIDFENSIGKMKVVEIDEKKHKCPKCDIRFSHARNIRRHIEKRHQENKQKYMCVLCKRLYSTQGNYDQHFEKTHLFEYLLYQNPELVDVKGNF